MSLSKPLKGNNSVTNTVDDVLSSIPQVTGGFLICDEVCNNDGIDSSFM